MEFTKYLERNHNEYIIFPRLQCPAKNILGGKFIVWNVWIRKEERLKLSNRVNQKSVEERKPLD